MSDRRKEVSPYGLTERKQLVQPLTTTLAGGAGLDPDRLGRPRDDVPGTSNTWLDDANGPRVTRRNLAVDHKRNVHVVCSPLSFRHGRLIPIDERAARLPLWDHEKHRHDYFRFPICRSAFIVG